MNAFKIPNFAYRLARGTKSGGVTMAAGTAGDKSITLTGGAGVFLKGDWFSLSHAAGWPSAYVCTGDEVAGVVNITPKLRYDVTGGAGVNTLDPDGLINDAMELPLDFNLPTIDVRASNPVYALPFSIELQTAIRRVPN